MAIANKTALFPGMFDPITLGHISLIQSIENIFSRIYINIGMNYNKRNSYLFSLSERKSMACEAIRSVALDSKCEIISYDGLTYKLASELKVDFVIRGVRDPNDFMREYTISKILHKHNVKTLLIPSSKPEISSSTAKELAYACDTEEELHEMTSHAVSKALFKSLNKSLYRE